jgi:uncharacterized protein DUF4112
MDKIGQLVIKKGANMATKKFLNKQFDDNKGRSPGGQWVSQHDTMLTQFAKSAISSNITVPQDPYFEYRPNKRGKMKKVRKQIPDYISEHDAKVLAEVRKLAYRLDVKLNFMGLRFGWAAVIGAVPEIGDILYIMLAYYVYSKCKKVEGGLDRKTKTKMKAWIAANGLIGLVPFVGDMVDASIKPNARNCRLLEEFLDRKYKPEHIAEAEQRLTAERRRQDPNYRPPAPATVYEDSDEDDYHHHHNNHHDDRTQSGLDRRGSGRANAYNEKRGTERRRR